MFTIKHISEDKKEFMYVSNASHDTYAKICLTDGASIQELRFNNTLVIKSPNSTNYKTSFASAILFPFTNRIKNGTYTYLQKKFNLELKTKGEKNALHGLVYNKKFSLFSKTKTDNSAQITLVYNEIKKAKGFPFLYSIYITYTLGKNTLDLDVKIKNKDTETFPFCIGWHPYFNTSDLHNSFIILKAAKKLTLNKNKIPIGIEEINISNREQIKNQTFDDCYLLQNNSVCFETPDYTIELNSSLNENYLQLFTPKEDKCIAIEPMSAPSNSFNNNWGLKLLKAEEEFSLTWKLIFKTNSI